MTEPRFIQQVTPETYTGPAPTVEQVLALLAQYKPSRNAANDIVEKALIGKGLAEEIYRIIPGVLGGGNAVDLARAAYKLHTHGTETATFLRAMADQIESLATVLAPIKGDFSPEIRQVVPNPNYVEPEPEGGE